MAPTLALLSMLAAGGEEWTRANTADGITLEFREEKGSPTPELRLTTVVDVSPERLCAAAFGTGKVDPAEPDLKLRKVLFESADERVTYEQIAPAIVSPRDYSVRGKRTRFGEGACRVDFTAAPDLAPPLPKGFVRIEKMRGVWVAEPVAGGKTKLTHLTHSEPAGAIPPFLIEGARRAFAFDAMKRIIKQARAPLPDAGTGT